MESTTSNISTSNNANKDLYDKTKGHKQRKKMFNVPALKLGFKISNTVILVSHKVQA